MNDSLFPNHLCLWNNSFRVLSINLCWYNVPCESVWSLTIASVKSLHYHIVTAEKEDSYSHAQPAQPLVTVVSSTAGLSAATCHHLPSPHSRTYSNLSVLRGSVNSHRLPWCSRTCLEDLAGTSHSSLPPQPAPGAAETRPRHSP